MQEDFIYALEHSTRVCMMLFSELVIQNRCRRFDVMCFTQILVMLRVWFAYPGSLL